MLMFEHQLTAERYLNLLEDHLPELLKMYHLRSDKVHGFGMTAHWCTL
jgi:hypothetical protein